MILMIYFIAQISFQLFFNHGNPLISLIKVQTISITFHTLLPHWR